MRAVVKHIELPAGRRAFAVSDVHGNLDYLKGLLDRIGFAAGDVLLLLGDMVEKGPRNIETLQYIMELSRTHTVHALRGNCDQLFFHGSPDEWLFRIRGHWNGNLLMNEFAARLGFTLSSPADVGALKEAVKREFPAEYRFLMDLPVILESERYIFVHGGVPREDDLESLEDWDCMKNDNFLRQGYSFHKKWCVVGHWPVTLYREDRPCADPLVSADRQIVSIDGGCVIKRDGQLNALRLPDAPAADRFTWTRYDELPLAAAVTAQPERPATFNIRFGDNEVEVLERGEEFSLCLHRSTGRKVSLLNQDLWETPRGVFCEDSTDYRLAVEPGDMLSVVQQTGRGCLVKKDGVTGWYDGTLTWRDKPCADA